MKNNTYFLLLLTLLLNLENMDASTNQADPLTHCPGLRQNQGSGRQPKKSRPRRDPAHPSSRSRISDTTNPIGELLKNLEEHIKRIREALGIPKDEKQAQWQSIYHFFARPIFEENSPLIFSVVGPTNIGKSTLFNAIASYLSPSKPNLSPLSTIGALADVTKRIVVMAHPSKVFKNQTNIRKGLLSNLRRRIGNFVISGESHQKTEDNSALIVPVDTIPEQAIFLDSPGHNTKDTANKDLAFRAYGTSEVLIYIFSKESYSTIDNYEFITQAIGSVGNRKSILVFKGHYSHSQRADIETMFQQVAGDLHPDSPINSDTGLPVNVEGRFVMVESAKVAENPLVTPELIPLNKGRDENEGNLSFPELVNDLIKRSQQIKEETFGNVLASVHKGATAYLSRLRNSSTHILEAESQIQQRAQEVVITNLTNFPIQGMREVSLELWNQLLPPRLRNLKNWTILRHTPIEAIRYAIKEKIKPFVPPFLLSDNWRQPKKFQERLTLAKMIDTARTNANQIKAAVANQIILKGPFLSLFPEKDRQQKIAKWEPKIYSQLTTSIEEFYSSFAQRQKQRDIIEFLEAETELRKPIHRFRTLLTEYVLSFMRHLPVTYTVLIPYALVVDLSVWDVLILSTPAVTRYLSNLGMEELAASQIKPALDSWFQQEIQNNFTPHVGKMISGLMKEEFPVNQDDFHQAEDILYQLSLYTP